MKNNRFFKYVDFILLDIISLVISFGGCYIWTDVHKFEEFNVMYRMLFGIEILLNIGLSYALNPYKDVLKRDSIKGFRSTVLFDVTEFIGSFFIIYLIRGQIFVSRIFYSLHLISYFLLSLVIRSIWKKMLLNKAKKAIYKGDKTLLVVTDMKNAGDIARMIDRNNYSFFRILGICVIDKKMKGKKIGNYDVVIDFDELIPYVCSNWVDDIYFDISVSIIPGEVLKKLSETGITIHTKISELDYFVGYDQYTEELLSYPVLTTCVKERSAIQSFIKRFVDILGSLVGCLITLILIIIIGPIIYIKSPGNIFYISTRIGQNGRPFKFYKFRSMNPDAEEHFEEVRKNNRVSSDLMFKMENDPRIIPGIGNFIRKTSLDEFPQFFNVLKGDMSMVGTRPPTIDEWNKYDTNYRMRMSIKPGITGMWQVSGRNNITDFDEVVRLDTYYIYRWSLGLDAKILFKTVIKLFKHEDAM